MGGQRSHGGPGFDNADILYALEKPWKHREYLHASHHSLSLNQLDQRLETKRETESTMDRQPRGSSFVETSPVDFQVICPYNRVILDSTSPHTTPCDACPPAASLKERTARP